MKKAFKLVALAAFAMVLAVACDRTPKENNDSTTIDSTPVQDVIEDTTPVIDTIPVVEEPQTTTKQNTKKPSTNKKKEQAPVRTNASEQSLNTSTGNSGTLSVGNKDTKKKEGTTSASQQSLGSSTESSGSFGLKKN
jgi:outer membrane biosynthesis protein TonB